MREFVAVDVAAPEEGARGRAPSHLTLRFLGEVTLEQQEWVRARLAEVAAASRPFVMRLDRVGAFPSAAHPRVVWVGVTDGRGEIEELARRVRAALEPEFGPDRDAFVPHLTLWRVRSPADRQAAEELLAGLRPAPPARDIPVHELLLKESVLGPKGAVHRTLASLRLGGPAPS